MGHCRSAPVRSLPPQSLHQRFFSSQHYPFTARKVYNVNAAYDKYVRCFALFTRKSWVLGPPAYLMNSVICAQGRAQIACRGRDTHGVQCASPRHRYWQILRWCACVRRRDCLHLCRSFCCLSPTQSVVSRETPCLGVLRVLRQRNALHDAF